MNKLKERWLAVEQYIVVRKHLFWMAAFIFFFFVFPFLVTENFAFDAISSTLP